MGVGWRPTARAQEPLTRIGDISLQSRVGAAKALPAQIRGVVTWRSSRGQWIVQDATGGCGVYADDARSRQLLIDGDAVRRSGHVGHVLEIEGGSEPGSYAPGIMPNALRIVGEQPLPAGRPMNPTRFFSGAEAGLRVEVRGVVQGFQRAETGWLPELNANPGRFTAEVRVTGVAVQGNNFAYFELELIEPTPAEKP